MIEELKDSICGDFGGAKSHDIQDRILNLDEEEKIYTLLPYKCASYT